MKVPIPHGGHQRLTISIIENTSPSTVCVSSVPPWSETHRIWAARPQGPRPLRLCILAVEFEQIVVVFLFQLADFLCELLVLFDGAGDL